MLPKISVITPSFNQRDVHKNNPLGARSRLSQSRLQAIIDGGGTDETVSILNRYSSRLAYWISEPDGGQARVINKGLAAATDGISPI